MRIWIAKFQMQFHVLGESPDFRQPASTSTYYHRSCMVLSTQPVVILENFFSQPHKRDPMCAETTT